MTLKQGGGATTSRRGRNRSAAKSPPATARTPTEIWERLLTLGGFEPEGRDADLATAIRLRIAGDADDMNAALAATTGDELVGAVFSIVAPFSQMLKEILAFLASANARRGRETIRMQIGDVPVDLREFEEFIRTLNESAAIIEIREPTDGDLFRYREALDDIGKVSTARDLPADVGDWLKAFGDGIFLPMPVDMLPSNMPQDLQPIAAIVSASYDALRAAGKTSEEVRETVPYRSPRTGSAFDAASIARCWHDALWPLARAVAAATLTLQDDRAPVIRKLSSLIASAPLRLVPTTGSLAGLERVLALPAWGKRHELYAVWIAARIAAAVESDRVRIHCPDGSMPFAFRKTRLMTIAAKGGDHTLWAERRTAFDKPIGKGRSKSVQPDYGIWRKSADDDEHARLIVEVKHYKTPNSKAFREALVDYARAHPRSEVLLVNYGAASNAGIDDPDAFDVGSRCHEIGGLTPTNFKACNDFAAMIRKAVGPPPQERIALLDTSGSMRDALHSPEAAGGVRSWLRMQPHLDTIIAVDDVERWRLKRDDAIRRLAEPPPLGGTRLPPLVKNVLSGRDDVLVVTDSDGRLQLEQSGLRVELEVQTTLFLVVRVSVVGRNSVRGNYRRSGWTLP